MSHGKHGLGRPFDLPQFPSVHEVDRIVAQAEQVLGYEFGNKMLLVQALTHPSAVEDDRVNCSYERLEFLGDALLNAIVSKEAYDRFPDMAEGGLTRLKSTSVSGTSLSALAGELGFGDLIIFGRSEQGTHGRGMHSALENVYESVVAALALDGGVEVAASWVLATLGPRLTKDLAAHHTNPKSQLQQVVQERGHAPVYEVVSEEGPPHDRTFTVRVLEEGQELGVGSGRSKKEAEAAAAQNALEQHNAPHSG